MKINLKRTIILFLLIIISPLSFAKPWYLNSENLIIDTELSSVSTIVPLDLSYSLDYVIINMSFFPKESWNQQVISFEATPEPKKINSTLQFRWDNPTEKDLKFDIKARVKTNNNMIAVNKKVDFPLKDISEDLIAYTKPSITIDSDNEEIINLANELAKGENDEFIVVYNLAEWVKNNIKYDLSTLTEEITQKASWVLKNKEGVCDEITTLFIALNRALGIPARFVSGISYTNLLEGGNWGPHGWAEIYFPNFGWVPFDVTYGEFGFIDPTHIKMKESLDGDEVSTKYQWLGKDVDLETRKLIFKTKLIEAIGEISPYVNLNLESLKKQIGFGSYNLIQSEIENLKDYYISTELYLSKPKEVEIIGRERVQVLLKPKEKKKTYWIIKLSRDLQESFIYTMPMLASTTNNETAETEFKATYNDPIYTEKEIIDLLDELREEERKKYSQSVDLNCEAKSKLYVYEKEEKAKCIIKNSGNVFLKKLNVCLENECRKLDIGIGQEKTIEFLIPILEPGKREISISAKNDQVTKTSSFVVEFLDEPKIEINDISYPERIKFGDEYNISFSLKKQSYSVPKELIINLDQNGKIKGWEMNELSSDKEFIVNLPGNQFSSVKNKFKIRINYKDENGKEYEQKEEFYINISKISFFQRFILLYNKLDNWFNGLFR